MNSPFRKAKIEMTILVNTELPELESDEFIKGLKDTFNPDDTNMELISGHEYSVLEYKATEVED